MSKRFTDTAIWDKEWFLSLSMKHKCLVRFLFDKCDAAGVWSANWMLASFCIGDKVTEDDLKEIPGLVDQFSPGKFFIVDFIEFQYGTLSENCKPHIKIIALLKKYNLYERVCIGYTTPFQRVEEKEEYKEEEEEKEKDEEGGSGEETKMSRQIISDFGFNEIKNIDKLRIASAFVGVMINNNRFEYFKKQYFDYHEFKNRSKEPKHNFLSFLGKQENAFKDGKWDDANWEQKLKDFELINKPNGNKKSISNLGTNNNSNGVKADGLQL